jgi:hypothetical protein
VESGERNTPGSGLYCSTVRLLYFLAQRGILMPMGGGFALFVVLFTLMGVIQIVRGWRGWPVPAGPRCGRCGYDLQGVPAAELRSLLNPARGSECGLDLSLANAVESTTHQRHRGRIIVGLGILSAPWALRGAMAATAYIGEHGERLRSNQSIIAAFAADPRPGWEPTELQRRANSGQLGRQDAAQAIEILIRDLNHSSDYSFAYVDEPELVRAFDRAGCISPAQYLQIAQAVCGAVPVLTVDEYNNNQLSYSIAGKTQDASHFFGCAYTFRDISIVPDTDDAASLPAQPWQGIDRPQPRQMSGWLSRFRNRGTLNLDVAPGSCRARFVIDLGIPFAHGLLMSNALGTASMWGSSKAQWTVILSLPLDIPAKSGRATITTEPRYNPKLNGTLSLGSIKALCYADGTLLLIELSSKGHPLIFFYDPIVVIDGTRFKGPMNFLPTTPMTEQTNCEIGPLAPMIHQVDLLLEPDLTAASTAGRQLCWGGKITFPDVSITRIPMQGTLADMNKVMHLHKTAQ